MSDYEKITFPGSPVDLTPKRTIFRTVQAKSDVVEFRLGFRV